MIKDKKENLKKKDKFPDVKTPAPPQDMNPSEPVQENAGHEKEQRPGDLRPDADKKDKKNEKPKLLGDPIEINDETTI